MTQHVCVQIVQRRALVEGSHLERLQDVLIVEAHTQQLLIELFVVFEPFLVIVALGVARWSVSGRPFGLLLLLPYK